MLRTIRVAQITIRLTGLALIILGILLWTGNTGLRQAHMGLGLLFVLALWSLAAVWGLVVLWLGMVQTRVWPGSAHVYVRVLHLLVGLVAIGVGEALAARIKRVHGAPRGDSI
jgi:hypothetical protein